MLPRSYILLLKTKSEIIWITHMFRCPTVRFISRIVTWIWFAYLIETEWSIYGSVNCPSLVQEMACRLVGANPSYEPMLNYCQLGPCKHISVKFSSKYIIFFIDKMQLKIQSAPLHCLGLDVLMPIKTALQPVHKNDKEDQFSCLPFHGIQFNSYGHCALLTMRALLKGFHLCLIGAIHVFSSAGR